MPFPLCPIRAPTSSMPAPSFLACLDRCGERRIGYRRVCGAMVTDTWVVSIEVSEIELIRAGGQRDGKKWIQDPR